jgi:hypothetical protein
VLLGGDASGCSRRGFGRLKKFPKWARLRTTRLVHHTTQHRVLVKKEKTRAEQTQPVGSGAEKGVHFTEDLLHNVECIYILENANTFYRV